MKILTLLLLTTLCFSSPIESIAPTGMTDLNLSVGPIFNIQQQTTQTSIDLKGVPFNRILQFSGSNEISSSPIMGLSFNFGQRKQEQRSLKQETLSMWGENFLDLTYASKNTNFALQQTERTTFDPNSWKNGELTPLQTLTNRNISVSQALIGGTVGLSRKTQTLSIPLRDDDTIKTDSLNINSLSLNIGSFAPKFSFGNERTERNDTLVSKNNQLQISMPLFGVESKYATGSSLDIPTHLSVNSKEIVLPFSKTIIYKLTDKSSSTNNILTTRDLKESISVPLDMLLSGSKFDYNRDVSLVPGKPEIDTTNRQILVPLKFISNGSVYQYTSQSRTEGNGPVIDTQQGALSFVFGKAKAIYVSSSTRTNHADLKVIDDFTFNYPVAVLHIPLNLVYEYINNRDTHKTDSRFSVSIPLKVLSGNMQNDIALSSLGQDRIASTLVIPSKVGPVTLSRVAIDGVNNDDNVTYNIESPLIKRKNLSIKATELVYDQENQPLKQQRGVNLAYEPGKGIQTTISFVTNDLKPEEHRVLTMGTSYAMSARTSLNVQYLERQQLDFAGPQTQTQLAFQHSSKKSGDLAVKATVADMNGPNQDFDPFSSVEASYGSDKDVQVSAIFSDYDNSKMVPLAQDIFGLEMKHVSSWNGISFKYQSSAARALPLLAIDTSWKLSKNTDVKVSMTSNPNDPRDVTQKVIRDGDVVDIGVSSKSVCGLAVQAGVRRYQDDNWANVSISGGDERSGQVKIGYQSGDFVPVNTTNIRSNLSVGYDRKFRDGQLSLSVNQELSDKDSTEAKLDVGIKF